MPYVSRPFTTFFTLASFNFIHPVLTLRRTIGPPGDHIFDRASAACDGANTKNFDFGVCSVLIACIYENLDEAFKASLSSGTNIASLLPTILVLIGKLVILSFLEGDVRRGFSILAAHGISRT